MKAQLHISHDLWIVAVKSVTPSLHVQPATPYMSFLLHTYLVIDAFDQLVVGECIKNFCVYVSFCRFSGTEYSVFVKKKSYGNNMLDFKKKEAAVEQCLY